MGFCHSALSWPVDCGSHLRRILNRRYAEPRRSPSRSELKGDPISYNSWKEKRGMVPLERHTYHRRLEKSITGHRTRVDVISRLPRPAFAAVVISSSLFRRVGVTPFFQWNTCRFQAPPLY